MTDEHKKPIREQIRQVLAAMSDQERHQQSLSACALLTASPEFAAARIVMLYLSTRGEVDTAPLALRCWQAGKTVVVPKITWDQRRLLPVEITTLQTDFAVTGPGVREPVDGKPVPVDLIDLVIVPGLAFSSNGYRLGRGMGFYDRFLAQDQFIGLSCGMAFSRQVVEKLPVLDHDMPLSMLVTEIGILRFASSCIRS